MFKSLISSPLQINLHCFFFDNFSISQLINGSIFNHGMLYFGILIGGNSLQDIQRELYNRDIKFPSGKEKWTRDVIDKTMKNKKYLLGIVSFEEFIGASIEKESRCRYGRDLL